MSCFSPDHLVLIKFKTQEELYKSRIYLQYNYWFNILTELGLNGKYRWIRMSNVSEHNIIYDKKLLPSFLYEIGNIDCLSTNKQNNLNYIS